MTTANILKERCRAILDIYPIDNRYALKRRLRNWIRNPKTKITLPDIDSLDLDELGIFLSCGAWGELYKYANAKAEKCKGGAWPPLEKLETGGNTPQSVTRALDEEKGLEQFTEEQIKGLITRSDKRDVYEIARLCAEKITGRLLAKEDAPHE